ncbi:hypothetical protein QR98_0080700 [Sarcoptes scabiei]|uniref:Uncharacterized protein n=1 Tax=Sarcoptes scabiei TaxID=52283 RepID=A0A132AF09_SARSC|nr:hypothetical protein QR98_0080700 [Sarcoptes scabiei]
MQNCTDIDCVDLKNLYFTVAIFDELFVSSPFPSRHSLTIGLGLTYLFNSTSLLVVAMALFDRYYDVYSMTSLIIR